MTTQWVWMLGPKRVKYFWTVYSVLLLSSINTALAITNCILEIQLIHRNCRQFLFEIESNVIIINLVTFLSILLCPKIQSTVHLFNITQMIIEMNQSVALKIWIWLYYWKKMNTLTQLSESNSTFLRRVKRAYEKILRNETREIYDQNYWRFANKLPIYSHCYRFDWCKTSF